ncbi:OmpA family protein [Psychrilyobacter atlanticus]|uniref:OmpA family protein n=1 Tax=Psychrilyobacter atlanticus TaxID=271091 RepID=UPI00040613E9|nr:OmpA family protein [Psychrilyobacter atlanticus]
MKKISILLAALVITGVSYGAQLELKGGFEPWREGNNSSSSFDQGGSLGAELLFNAENSPFDYGIGMEWKSEFSGGENNVLAETKSNAFPVYLTGKYGIGEDLFYLVGRAGWAMYDTSESIDGFYGAVGVGKQFAHITVEALYESMDLSGSSHMYSGDRANLASIKFGYKFGENKRDVISREKEEALKAEYEKQQAEEAAKIAAENKAKEEAAALETENIAKENERTEILKKYNNVIVADGYSMDKNEPMNVNQEFLENIASDLSEESGTLTVRAYTDNTGSEAANLRISKKRADKAAEAIREGINNENIEVISEGLGETNFLTDNSTLDKRKTNRRIEVNFIAK